MNPIAPKTVLYVEDNPVNVYLVQAILEPRPGVRLVIASDGAQGLDLARQQRPVLILLDMNLPDMDGEGFLKLLRADAVIAGIPVVILSADELQEERKHLAALGVSDFVTKPFEIDEFERLIDRYLKN